MFLLQTLEGLSLLAETHELECKLVWCLINSII